MIAARQVLLAGASGYIGRAVASELVNKNFKVTSVLRDSASAPAGCERLVADITDAAQLEERLANRSFTAVISCVASRTGMPDDTWLVDFEANRSLLAIAKAAGASHFVLLSAICVQRPQLEFQRAKLAFEAELADAGIDFTIVRPTAFFRSLSGQVDRVQQGRPFLLFDDGSRTACKPISARDLASFLVNCLDEPSARNQILPIGGPGEAITPRQQGELLFELAGRPVRFRRVPSSLFTAAIGVLTLIGKLFPRAANKAEFARIGRYYARESMLVWDAENDRYSAEATPATGNDTLRNHYEQVLRDGLAGHEAGEHKLF